MPRTLPARPLSILLFAACCASAQAHDFWIEPATFRPDLDQRVSIGLRVGDDFDGVPYARNPYHIREFVLHAPSARSAVPGLAGAQPAGLIRIAEPGLHLIGYWSTHTPLELPADRFEVSLKREGLEHVVRARAARGDSDKAATEAFFRCAKALLKAGDGAGSGYDRVLGLPLELVPEADPYSLAPGDELPLRALYLGEPLAGLKVVAMNAGAPDAGVSGRTGADGRVRLVLDRPGMWLIKGVHMVPAPPQLHADWESAWASLTFELPEY